jgi:hypothetical protein
MAAIQNKYFCGAEKYGSNKVRSTSSQIVKTENISSQIIRYLETLEIASLFFGESQHLRGMLSVNPINRGKGNRL